MSEALNLEQRLEPIPASPALRLVPVRHHSPACAYHLRTLIQRDQPESILIEGPSDATPLLTYLGERDAVPPLALYCFYRPDTADAKARYRCFYPLAAFSPEWLAIREGLKIGATVSFIDLPYGERLLSRDTPPESHAEEEVSLLGEREWLHADPMARLIERSGCRDFNEWWDRYFESGAIATEPEDYFRNLLSWCLLLRDTASSQDREAHAEQDARERYMAAQIQAELDQGRRCLVVTGGYHTEAIAAHLRAPQPPPAMTQVPGERGIYLLPYTLQRLDSANHYAAGIPNTGYYQAVWRDMQSGSPTPYIDAGSKVALRVGRALAEAGEPVSFPDSIEAAVLSRRLAALRGTPFGRPELLDAMVAAFGKDALDTDGDKRLQMLAQQLGGDQRGRLPKTYPMVPLVADFRAQCERFKLTLTPLTEAEKILDIYRSARHRQLSRFLHQLRFLDVPYGSYEAGPDFTTGTNLERVREIWRLRWRPETDAALTECMMYGAQLEDAALNRLLAQLDHSVQTPPAPSQLLDALRMGLQATTGRIMPYVKQWLTEEHAFPGLVHGLTQLHLAYAAQTALAAVGTTGLQPILAAAFERACLRMTWLGQMDDDATAACTSALSDLNSLARADADWQPDVALFERCVETLYDSDQAAPAALRGQAAAILTTRQLWPIEQTATALTEAFHEARGKPAYLGGFLLGFLPLARGLLLQTPDLVRAMGEVMLDWDEATFLDALPSLRLAFTALKPRETAELGQLIGRLLNREPLDVNTPITWSKAELKQLRQLHHTAAAALQTWGFGEEVTHAP